jgi:hypothetical protein
MSTIPHQPSAPLPERRGWLDQLRIAEMWASLAIFAMWIAVSVASVWGPDFVSTSSDGSSTTVPSGVAVALFATIGSWAVAKHAFGHHHEES